jgi:hypothetical protein
MIGFIDAFFCSHSELRSVTAAHNKWLPKTPSIVTGLRLSSLLVCLLLFWLRSEPLYGCLLIYECISSWFSLLLRLLRTMTDLRMNAFCVWVLCYYRRFSRPVYLGIKHPSGACDQVFITVRQLWVCWCGALSLTWGRLCRLQLLLVLASAVILGSESRGTRYHILQYQIGDFPFRRLLRLAGLRWRYSTPPPHGCECVLILTAACIV